MVVNERSRVCITSFSEHVQDFISYLYFEGQVSTSAALKLGLANLVGDTKSPDEEAFSDDVPRLSRMNSQLPFDGLLLKGSLNCPTTFASVIYWMWSDLPALQNRTRHQL